MSDMLTVLTVILAEREVDAVMEAAAGLSPTAWVDEDTRDARIDLFLENDEMRPNMQRRLEAAVELALNGKREVRCHEVAREDWSQSWKRHFHAEKVSEHIVIRPSWEEYSPAEGEIVIQIDPGMSFGTGLHGTTRGCLVLLDELAQESSDRTVLDMGCGSGILSIAAVKLGFAHVDAFDIDPDSVNVTLENAAINGVSDNIRAEACALPSIPEGMIGDIVVANILAVILIENAEAIAAVVPKHPNARLVLSGILEEQYAKVREVFASYGFTELRTVLLGEWCSAVFKR